MTIPMQERQKIAEMCAQIRPVFLQMLQDSIKSTDTKGSCAFACYFAKHAFEQFTDYKVFYRGGDGNGDGGYLDQKGQSQGHYWLELITTSGNSFIVDLTSDQFGDEPVVVIPLAENARYVNGCQETIDDHFTDFLG